MTLCLPFKFLYRHLQIQHFGWHSLANKGSSRRLRTAQSGQSPLDYGLARQNAPTPGSHGLRRAFGDPDELDAVRPKSDKADDSRASLEREQIIATPALTDSYRAFIGASLITA